jgi:mono/diheme cytochrome c family protein
MIMNKNRLMLYMGMALIVATIVVACSGAPAPTQAPAAEQPTAAPATEQPTAAPATEQPTAAPAAGEAGEKTATTEEEAAVEEVARPSNPGGPGPAIDLTGDAKAGEQVYVDNCQKCHGENGTGGVDNPGSDDGTIPPLNPIDETMVSKDPKVFAVNIDLFIEHGSSPEGDNPKEVMAAWGDDKKLTPQQIADVIAYVISLNTTQ